MTELKEVTTSAGVFTIKKPGAGVRNKALMKAETDRGFKSTVFLMELLPKCVVKRPLGMDETTPIEHILDGLETDDYDILAQALNEMMKQSKESFTEAKAYEKKAESSSS